MFMGVWEAYIKGAVHRNSFDEKVTVQPAKNQKKKPKTHPNKFSIWEARELR